MGKSKVKEIGRRLYWPFAAVVVVGSIMVACVSVEKPVYYAPGTTSSVVKKSTTVSVKKNCTVQITGNSPALHDNYMEVFQSLGCIPVASRHEATLLATASREEWRSDCGSNLRARLLVYSGGNLLVDKSSTKKCISYGPQRVREVVFFLKKMIQQDFVSYQSEIIKLL